jgi:hypothetical protein
MGHDTLFDKQASKQYNHATIVAQERQKMVQPKTVRETDWKITVRLPRALQRPAQEKARRTKRSLNRLIADAVQREVERPEPAYANEHERVLAVLKESGLLDEPWGAEWDSHIQGPIPTLEEVRQMLRGQPPLSEDIIEMRGER